MSIYKSGGFPYIGVYFESGTTDVVPPPGWNREEEIYEFTDFSREWDQVDFTSHDAALTAHGFTRTAKPGLGVQSVLTFRGIWLENSHNFFSNLHLTRVSWPFRFTYSFTDPTTPLTYYFVAWCSNYTLSGDLGDKFVYSVTLVCDGDPQSAFPPSSKYVGTGMTRNELMDGIK